MLNGFLSKFYSRDKIKNAGVSQMPQQQAAIPGININPASPTASPYQYRPYQIKTGDTFENIATQNNMNVADIQAANSGLTVPPPKGSYINLPNGQMALGPANVPMSQTDYANNMSDYWKQYNYGAHTPGGLATPYNPYTAASVAANTWDNRRGDTYDPKQLQEIQGMIAGGQAPNSVPVGMLASLGATPQSMTENGYAFDPVTRTYYLMGPGGTQTGTGQVTTAAGTGSAEFMNTGFMQKYAEKGTSFTNQLRWDPKRKKYVKIGQLIKEGKLDVKTGRFYPNGRNANHGGVKGGYNRGGGGQQAPAPEPVYGSGGTPTTVLSLHLGGG